MSKDVMKDVVSGTLVSSDGTRVAYDHYRNGHPKAVVIAHGFFNSRKALLLKDLARELLKDYDVVMMDFRGHGDSGGLFDWTASEDKDLEAVLRYTRAQEYSRVGTVGFSLGGSISILTQHRTGLSDSLVVVSSPTDFSKIDYRLWELDFENDIVYNLGEGRVGKGIRPGPFWLGKVRPVDVVGEITAPVLYVHGDKDWVIKPWHTEVFFEKTRSRKKKAIIKNGPHAEYLMRKNREETVALIREWLSETL